MGTEGRVAIVSDIHGNLEALQAVLADIQEYDVDSIICLGDVVGYGPNPRECIDAAMQFDVCIMGNHEEALLYEKQAENFNYTARAALNWTRMELDATSGSQRRWDFISSLQSRYNERGYLFVHGSPRDPIHEYVFPYASSDLKELFDVFKKACFIGHTHFPGVFTPEFEHLIPESIFNRYKLGRKGMVNVGSVGQPRDGNNKASYVIYDQKESAVTFRRIPYDFMVTMNKIRQIADLHDSLGERLAFGK